MPCVLVRSSACWPSRSARRPPSCSDRRPRHRRPGSASGDIVVVRVGTAGGSPLSNAATAVFLDEYTPSGTLVQSVPLPTSARGEQPAPHDERHGDLGRRPRPVGGRAVPDPGRVRRRSRHAHRGGTTSAHATNRVVAGSTGAATSTRRPRSPTPSAATDIRGAVTDDGSRFWAVGVERRRSPVRARQRPARPPRSTARRRPTCVWRPSPTVSCYVSTGSAPTGVYAVGAGLPTTGGQVPSLLTTIPSPYGFVALDRDPDRPGHRHPVRGRRLRQPQRRHPQVLVRRHGLDGPRVVPPVGERGARAHRAVTPGGVTLYATTTAAASQLVMVSDSAAFDAPIDRHVDSRSRSRAANTAFRGVAFAPTGGGVERADHQRAAAGRDDRQRRDGDADRGGDRDRPAELPVVRRAAPATRARRSGPMPPSFTTPALTDDHVVLGAGHRPWWRGRQPDGDGDRRRAAARLHDSGRQHRLRAGHRRRLARGRADRDGARHRGRRRRGPAARAARLLPAGRAATGTSPPPTASSCSTTAPTSSPTAMSCRSPARPPSSRARPRSRRARPASSPAASRPRSPPPT